MHLWQKDIHSHILPALDDGFQNADDSLRAIELMASHGCREIVFTPHINPDLFPATTENVCREVYDTFRAQIPERWGITTSLSAEYMVVRGFEKKVSEEADTLLTFPDGSVLIEMSYLVPSPNLEQTIFELNVAGHKPILAHPERYSYMYDCLEEFDRLYDMGCGFTMSASSLLGIYGPPSKKIMNYLLKHNMYSSIATDLHSLDQLKRVLAYRPGFFQKRMLRKCPALGF